MTPPLIERAFCVLAAAVASLVALHVPGAPQAARPAPALAYADESRVVETFETFETVAVVTQPAPIVNRTPTEVERSQRCPEFEELFAEYGLEPVDTFSFIAWRETRCDPTKVNAEFGSDGKPTKTLNRDGSYDVGLLQVNSTWKTVTHETCGTPWGQMFALIDLDCNLRVARYLLDNGGLGHWSL
jgi:hypothetical protein